MRRVPPALLRGLAIEGILVGAYLVLHLLSFVDERDHSPRLWPDTSTFESVARLPFLSLDFFTGLKPWALPLLYKLLPGSTAGSAPIAQLVISTGAWLTLAFVVARLVEHRGLRAAGVGLVLAFSLVPVVAQWDGVLLSESLSLSLAALLVAALLVASERPTWLGGGLVLASGFLLAATRDTSGLLVLIVVVPVGIVIAVRRSRRVGLVLVVGAAAIFGITYASYNVRRWEIPLAHVIVDRIIPSPSARAYFVERGMPVRPHLAEDVYSARIRFADDPRLADFRPWFLSRARGTYASYELSHPGYSLERPLSELSTLVSPGRSLPLGLSFFKPAGFRSTLPSFLEFVLYPVSGWLLVGWMGAGLLLAGVCWRRGVARSFWLVPVLGLVSTIPHALVVWNGDSLEIGRHSLLVAVLLRLSLLLLALFALDSLVAARRRSSDEVPV